MAEYDSNSFFFLTPMPSEMVELKELICAEYLLFARLSERPRIQRDDKDKDVSLKNLMYYKRQISKLFIL